MRPSRYTIVACILLILSVFSFVLAAPVAVQEVREACTDAVAGGDKVITGLGKRADEPPPLPPSSPPRPSTSTPSNAGSRILPNMAVSSGESKPPAVVHIWQD
jgi:hypothetical protein